MLSILSVIFGLLSSLIPTLIRIWERKLEFKHEVEMIKIQLEAKVKGFEYTAQMEDSRNLVREGDSVRHHDLSLGGNSTVETLRASVRPVITYAFFGLFCIIKLSVIFISVSNGANIKEVYSLLWGQEELALFGSILGFWFGGRLVTKMEELKIKKNLL